MRRFCGTGADRRGSRRSLPGGGQSLETGSRECACAPWAGLPACRSPRRRPNEAAQRVHGAHAAPGPTLQPSGDPRVIVVRRPISHRTCRRVRPTSARRSTRPRSLIKSVGASITGNCSCLIANSQRAREIAIPRSSFLILAGQAARARRSCLSGGFSTAAPAHVRTEEELCGVAGPRA
jgi:hypothetical protein